MSDLTREKAEKIVHEIAKKIGDVCQGYSAGAVFAAQMALMEFSLTQGDDKERNIMIQEIEQFGFHLRHRDWSDIDE